MNRLFAFLLLGTIAFHASAKDDFSLVIYDTYQDYQQGKGRAMYEFIGYDWTLGVLHLFYRVKKKDEGRVNVNKAYGYSIGDQFYRVVKGRPYRVLMQGKFVYYENGIAHMSMLVGNEDEAIVELGDWHFVSDDLNSDIMPFPSAEARKHFADRPELNGMFECLEKVRKKKTEKIRECVKDYI